MTKKLIELGCLGLAAWTLSGCSVNDLGNAIYDPVVTTNMVETPTGSYPVVTTNGWVVSSSVKSGVNLAGDLAPTPYGGLVANAVLAVLGILAHVRSRKWKNATISAVSAAQDFKRELSNLDTKAAQATKQKVRTNQKVRGTQTEIQKALDILG